MVIILTNYDGPNSQMLNTKFRGNQFTGSGEDFRISAWQPSWSCDRHHISL